MICACAAKKLNPATVHQSARRAWRVTQWPIWEAFEKRIFKLFLSYLQTRKAWEELSTTGRFFLFTWDDVHTKLLNVLVGLILDIIKIVTLIFIFIH